MGVRNLRLGGGSPNPPPPALAIGVELWTLHTMSASWQSVRRFARTFHLVLRVHLPDTFNPETQEIIFRLSGGATLPLTPLLEDTVSSGFLYRFEPNVVVSPGHRLETSAVGFTGQADIFVTVLAS